MAAAETTFRAMASHVQVIVVDGSPQAGLHAKRALAELESTWSRFIPGSDISRLNNANGKPIPVHPVTLRLIDTMLQATQLTSGRYDATILPALMAAGYTASIDDPSAVTTLSNPATPHFGQARGLSGVRIDRGTRVVSLPEGIALDPGGLGKGLAADLVVAELVSRGAAGALVSVGGDLAAAGEPPPQGWLVDIEDHLDSTEALTRMSFTGGGVATSSTLTRRWIHTSTDQHHVIDPATGKPSRSDLVAATVVAPCGWHAEAHATGVLLGGTADFDRYTEHHGIHAVATTSSGVTLSTDSLVGLLPVGTA